MSRRDLLNSWLFFSWTHVANAHRHDKGNENRDFTTAISYSLALRDESASFSGVVVLLQIALRFLSAVVLVVVIGLVYRYKYCKMVFTARL